ncbi:glycosyltransferase [Allokutzneria sp. A3M-2-11 16]|uniref:glycosyltransferase n=1 Tax=Allokutzneria sp. A3M-2-11 16 TaxID=2962043 RepID=UPI0020B78B03|nr:glycosyltransferase [Allokutzneria sp. A3M-2-11 16]MCP3803614.1 glycosyltransferase [Allokutzneria sp. A3M-2-11 16]
MNVVECHYEFGGFDHRLVKGGISVYLWNLSQALSARGVGVSGLTAAHGALPLLRQDYDVTDLDYVDDLTVDVPLDPLVWKDFGESAKISARITAHRVSVRGVDVVVLAGGILDAYPETFYPPYETKGRDLAFLKPLVFQLAATRYLVRTMAPRTVVHLHEPYYHYLMPQPLRAAGAEVVCTVQSNMPVNKKVYGREVRELVSFLGGDASAADGLEDPPLDSAVEREMRAYLPTTHLYNEYPERPGHDYVSGLALVARTASALDFLSPGQLEHVVTQGDTPAEALFQCLAVRRELRAAADKLVVGGCAVGSTWREADRSTVDRAAVLRRRGLDPALPTIFHNARYAIHHKGQRELARALRELLDEGLRFNAVLHVLSPSPMDDPELNPLAAAHPDVVWLETGPMPEPELIELACASELCLFPSKFEMDTFLLAMGEAMACGAVPVATAQRGMEHFEHVLGTTGASVPRSFRADDRALVDEIKSQLRRLLAMELDSLRANAVRVARSFTWEKVAADFHAIFDSTLHSGLSADPVALLRRGWGDLLDDEALARHAVEARDQALSTGDVELARRLGIADDRALFEAARERGDVAGCALFPEYETELASRGSVVDEIGQWRVSYRFGPVRTADLVREGRAWPLYPTGDGGFGGTVPASAERSAVLLLTLTNGRVVWDELEVKETNV